MKSYNWDGALQLGGNNFAYCVRRESGYCSITYYPEQSQPSTGIGQ